MKKITGLILTILLLAKIVLAQNANEPGLVAQQINNIIGAGISFEKASLFTSSIERTSTYGVYEELSINEAKLRNLFLKNDDFIELSIPRANAGEMKLMLKKHEVLTDDFILTSTKDNERKTHQRPDVICYQGIIKNDFNSIVAITVFENEINGVISNDEGNYNLGKDEKDPFKYVLYNDHTMQLPLQFNCGYANDNNTKAYKQEELVGNKMMALTKCQKIFFDCDYDLYLNKGNVTNVNNYMVSLFNVVGTLYNNEGVNISIQEIHVWTTPDPFCDDSSFCALFDFQTYYPFINGANIGQLVTMDAGNNGGLGNIGSLFCAAFSYSDIDGSVLNFPAYSWDAEVVTHEIGHNLNSQHTHACAWNGNGTAIDGCSVPVGCSNPGIPAGGGTIMSYCHQQPVGIHFNLGFGIQPGNVIRTYINNGLCFVTCDNDCLPYVFVGAPVSSGNTANYSASDTVYSATTMASGSNVQFNAGNGIQLHPGFFAENGSTFVATIASCTPLLSPEVNNNNVSKLSDYSTLNNEVQISPNPFHSNFELSFNLKQDEKTSVAIYNMLGVKVKEISQHSLVKGLNKISIDCNDLVSGVYMIEINLDGIKTVKRIVKN